GTRDDLRALPHGQRRSGVSPRARPREPWIGAARLGQCSGVPLSRGHGYEDGVQDATTLPVASRPVMDASCDPGGSAPRKRCSATGSVVVLPLVSVPSRVASEPVTEPT